MKKYYKQIKMTNKSSEMKFIIPIINCFFFYHELFQINKKNKIK